MPTQRQNDLKQAKAFLNKVFPELKETEYIVYHEKENKSGYCIDEIIVDYVLNLEQLGVIKFTANRVPDEVLFTPDCSLNMEVK